MHPSMHCIWNKCQRFRSLFALLSLVFILCSPAIAFGVERRDSAAQSAVAPDSVSLEISKNLVSHFHAFNTPNSVQLVWNTHSKEKLFVFQIEKWNGIAFEAIGKVEKSGLSHAPFVFEDINPQVGSNLYRVVFMENETPKYISQTTAVFLTGTLETHPVIMSASWQGSDSMFVSSNYHADRKVQAFLVSEKGEATYLNEIAFNNKGVAVIPANACGLKCRLVLFEPHWQQFCHIE